MKCGFYTKLAIIKIKLKMDTLITLAIHKKEKAWILKDILERNSINVCIEEVEKIDQNENLESYYIKIHKQDLTKALVLIEEVKLFSYKDKEINKIDDGRRRILVAVDFSDYSLKACQVAFNIAKDVNAKVKILHVYQNIYFPSHIPFADTLKKNPEEGLLNKTRKQMLDLCMNIDNKISKGEWSSVNYSYSIREGQVEDEIANFVAEYTPELLVLGTKGKHNDGVSILGNVTADVIEIINIPVLAIPDNFSIPLIEDTKHIVYLTNFKKRDFSSIEKLINVLKLRQGVKITFLHIASLTNKQIGLSISELENMKEKCKTLYPDLNIDYLIIDSPNVVEAVENFVKKEQVTVIAMNSQRRNILGRIFSPSMARKILVNSDKALLILRD